MLTQRIGKSSTEFLTIEGVSAEAVFLMGKDLNTFKDVAQGLLQGSAELRLPGARDGRPASSSMRSSSCSSRHAARPVGCWPTCRAW
jgi:hypothetical protein